MKTWQHNQLRRALEKRHAILVEEFDRDAARLREASLADIGAEELRGIEAARQRLAEGTYGICVDCGVEIRFERLQAQPVAARCLECQARHENTYEEARAGRR